MKSLALTLCAALILTQSLLSVPHAKAEASDLTLTVYSDDTAALVNDASTTNGIVPSTGGLVTYQWGWGNPGGSSATFSQELPPGMLWEDESVVTGCTRSGTITSGQTLTCTLTGLVGIGSTRKIASVHNLANGTIVTSHLTSGSQNSSPVSLTVAATPAIATAIGTGSALKDALDPESPGTEPGIALPYVVSLFVPRTSTDGAKGAEPLQGPLVITATVPAGAKLMGCYDHLSVTVASGVSYSTALDSTNSNQVPNGGTWGCVQTGTTITITVTGYNANFLRFPTLAHGGGPAPADRGYFSAGSFYLWRPLSDYTVNVAKGTNVSLTGPTVTSISNQVATSPSSSGLVNFTRTASSLVTSIGIGGIQMNSTGSQANGAVYPGSTFTITSSMALPVGSGTTHTNTSYCQVWDPSTAQLSNIANPVTGRSGLGGVNTNFVTGDIQIEYGTAAYTSEAQRKAADCGTVGDGNPSWYTSFAAAIASPGGLASISAVRIKYLHDQVAGQGLSYFFTYVASSDVSLAAKTKIPFYVNDWSDQASIVRSTWTSLAGTLSPTTGYSGTGSYGNQATLATAQVRNTVNLLSTDVRPGMATSVTIQPIVTNPVVTDGRNAVNTTVTATLPDGCFTFVPGSLIPASVTPSQPATPTSGHTCRDVAGQVVVWNLGDVPTTPAVTENPINFTLNLDPSTPSPYIATITSLIASDSDMAYTTLRTATDTITVSSVNDFSLTQTASLYTSSPGIPVTYRLGWSNGLTSSIGQAWIVDVLPYNGDGRGTAGVGSLLVDSVVTNPGSLGIEYTSDNPGTLMSQVISDATGNTGITWTSVRPTTRVTGIRIRTQFLSSNDSGYADITIRPTSLSPGGQLVNDIYAKADTITNSGLGLSPVVLTSTSSLLSGIVYKDLDHSGTQNTGDLGIENAVVTLSGYNFGANGIDNGGTGDDIAVEGTTLTDSNGAYQFIVAQGKYSLSSSYAGLSALSFPATSQVIGASVIKANQNFLFEGMLASGDSPVISTTPSDPSSTLPRSSPTPKPRSTHSPDIAITPSSSSPDTVGGDTAGSSDSKDTTPSSESTPTLPSPYPTTSSHDQKISASSPYKLWAAISLALLFLLIAWKRRKKEE